MITNKITIIFIYINSLKHSLFNFKYNKLQNNVTTIITKLIYNLKKCTKNKQT